MYYKALHDLVLPKSTAQLLTTPLHVMSPLALLSSFSHRHLVVSHLRYSDVLSSLPENFSPQLTSSYSAGLSLNVTFSGRLMLTTLFHSAPPLCLIFLYSINQNLFLHI